MFYIVFKRQVTDLVTVLLSPAAVEKFLTCPSVFPTPAPDWLRLNVPRWNPTQIPNLRGDASILFRQALFKQNLFKQNLFKRVLRKNHPSFYQYAGLSESDGGTVRSESLPPSREEC